MTFTCLCFSPEVMVKFTRKAKENCATLIKISMHPVECISGQERLPILSELA